MRLRPWVAAAFGAGGGWRRAAAPDRRAVPDQGLGGAAARSPRAMSRPIPTSRAPSAIPRAVRAVGTAVGRNPISWLIPCHRALRKSGGLGGYHWGLPVKRAMLAWEAARRDQHRVRTDRADAERHPVRRGPRHAASAGAVDLNVLAGNLLRYPNSTIFRSSAIPTTPGRPPTTRTCRSAARSRWPSVLRAGGVAPARIILRPGEDQPIASNLTPEGRQQNRRVDITIRPNQ
jgi:hypothetical protein